MGKPTVYYTPSPDEYIVKGDRALVFNVKNHPNQVLSGDVVSTSKVVEDLGNGVFVTLNTIYRPNRRKA